MWSAEGVPTGRRRSTRGFTLVEVMIVAGVVALMSFALNYAVQSTQSAEDQLETAGRAALHGQRLTDEMAKLVTASRHIYDDSLVGQGYLAACDLSRFPPAPDARLPLIDGENELGPDVAGASHTGNILLLLRETAGSPCVADRDTGKIWLIDTYRLTAIYPHVTSRSLEAGRPTARDLVIWQSEAFPSLQQIMEILDRDERKSVIADLVKEYGFEYAWDPRLEIRLAFHRMEGKGEIASAPAPNMAILEEPVLSRGPQLVRDDVRLAATRRAGSRAAQCSRPRSWAPGSRTAWS